MKKILLTSIFFLGMSVVVVAQKQQAKKPVATTSTKKVPKAEQKAADKNVKLEKQAADAERLKALQTAKSLEVSNSL